jgi:arginyl-tRNA synthetase
MAQDVKTQLTALLQQALASVAPNATDTAIHLERPRDPTHGDFATNLAMQLAKALKKNPREIAQQLLNELPPSTLVTKAEVAGAGFINFTLDAGTKTDVVKAVLVEKDAFGRSTAGKQQKVQVEFVSANPTGPLHVGHGRGAAYGASLSSLLSFAGWDVTREYYVNDAGRQMDILGLSTWLRYLDQHGQTVPFPPNAYQGSYVRDMAEQLKHAHGDKYLRSAEAVQAGTPGLPEAGRADDEAKQQRELHLDALIAQAKELLGPDWEYVHQHALNEQLADCRDDWSSLASSSMSGSPKRRFTIRAWWPAVSRCSRKKATFTCRTAPNGSGQRPSAMKKTASCSAKTVCSLILPPILPTT